jgi:hypothetical protein
VASNAAIKVLKTQDATSAAAVAERFHLTRSEQQRLITFSRQEALVLAGGKRVTINIQASQAEHALITTNPVERAENPSFPPGHMTIRSVDRQTQTREALQNGPLCLMPTGPLHLLEVQGSNEDTVKIRTNHHRQPAQHTIV